MSMRCRGIELVLAVGLVLGWVLPGCAKVKDVVATEAPLGGDAAAKDASVDAGGTGKQGDAGGKALGDAGDCGDCYDELAVGGAVFFGCRVSSDPSSQALLFKALDRLLGLVPTGGETRMLDRCDGAQGGKYPHDYQDADGHFLCPWYCNTARTWVQNNYSKVTACTPCLMAASRP